MAPRGPGSAMRRRPPCEKVLREARPMRVARQPPVSLAMAKHALIKGQSIATVADICGRATLRCDRAGTPQTKVARLEKRNGPRPRRVAWGRVVAKPTTGRAGTAPAGPYAVGRDSWEGVAILTAFSPGGPP